MNLNEAKQILKNAGYIVEDTDDWDEADMPIGTPKQRADRVNKHSSFRDLDHKYTDAANFISLPFTSRLGALVMPLASIALTSLFSVYSILACFNIFYSFVYF